MLSISDMNSSHKPLSKMGFLAFLVILPAIFLALIPTQTQAGVALTVTTAGGPSFKSLLGQSLPEGCVIRVGLADLTDANVRNTLQNANDASAIEAVLTSLGEVSANGTVNQAGNTTSQLRVNNFAGTGVVFGAIEEVPAAQFTATRSLVMWVFNAASPADATEWGIYTASTGWETPPDLGAQVLNTSSVTEALRGAVSAGGLTLASVRSNSYASWASGLGNTNPMADWNGDRVPNVLKYLTAADPNKPASAPVSVNASTNEAQITVDTTRTDVAWEIQGSNDLVNWQTLDDQVIGSYGNTTRYKASAPAGATRWFYRVAARLIATP